MPTGWRTTQQWEETTEIQNMYEPQIYYATKASLKRLHMELKKCLCD